ncbi:hypothetical protein GCM10027030_18020 [Luteococcus sediminum]
MRQLVEQKRGGRPESWASYLARMAAVFRCPLSILERQLTVKAHAVTITPTAAQTAAARLNITAHQVHAITCSRWTESPSTWAPASRAVS